MDAVNHPRAGGPDLRVSVLLPTFDRADYLGEAIASVLAQTHAPHEVIVIDDGSTAETAGVCAAFGDAIRYLRNDENRGKSAAINRGLEAATGAFIWVMDDDDLAPPEALATLIAPMARAPHVGFTFGRLLKFSDTSDGRRLFTAGQEPPADLRPLFVRLMEDCFITGQPCVLYRRGCLDDIGRIDETVLASVDYNILLQIARRHEAVDVGKVVLWQRQHLGARGPARLRYDFQAREGLWKAFDQRLLAALLPGVAPRELVGRKSGRKLSADEQRRALFQRAVIAGRKDLWEMAVESLSAAMAGFEARELADGDRFILQRMLGSRYGVDALLGDRAVQRRLKDACGPDPLGAQLRLEIASHLPFWIGTALRQGRFERAWLGAVALHEIAGGRGCLRLVCRIVAKRLRLGKRLAAAMDLAPILHRHKPAAVVDA